MSSCVIRIEGLPAFEIERAAAASIIPAMKPLVSGFMLTRLHSSTFVRFAKNDRPRLRSISNHVALTPVSIDVAEPAAEFPAMNILLSSQGPKSLTWKRRVRQRTRDTNSHKYLLT